MSKSVPVVDDDQSQETREKPAQGKADGGQNDAAPVELSRRLKLWFSLVTVMGGVLVILLSLEGSLWLLGYQSPVSDPYESFVARSPLFKEADGMMITDIPRSHFFHVQRFPRFKPAGTKRVFVFGGSTTFGYALDNPKQDSYVNQLGLQLQEKFPGTQFEMINCGGKSYASYRLVDLVEECVEYSPDLVIIMSGHNEFIEARHYKDLIADDSFRNQVWYRTKTAHLVDHVASWVGEQLGSADKSGLGANPFVTEKYIVRDPNEFRLTFEHYTRNLKRMIEACRAHDTPVILCTCPSNLLDHKPFYTEPPAGMSLEEFERREERAKELEMTGRPQQALKMAEEILKDDPDSAFFLFIAGRCHYQLGNMDQARELLMQAKDKDDFPKRTLTNFNERVRELAAEYQLPLFDGEKRFLDEAPERLPGEDLFEDDCHPTKIGHFYFADGLRDLAAEALQPAGN